MLRGLVIGVAFSFLHTYTYRYRYVSLSYRQANKSGGCWHKLAALFSVESAVEKKAIQKGLGCSIRASDQTPSVR